MNFKNIAVSSFLAAAALSLSLASIVHADSNAGAGGPAAPAAVAPAVPAGSEQAAAPAAQQPGFMGTLFPFILMFGVVYFLMIRPQQKKMKEQQEMIGALKHGDEVLTTSGILGKITGIADKVVTVEVADNVRVKMLKSQVSQVIKGQIKDIAQ